MTLTLTLNEEEHELVNDFHQLIIEMSHQFENNKELFFNNDTYAQLERINMILTEHVLYV